MKTLNYNIIGDTAKKVINAADVIGKDPSMTISNILATSNSVSLYYSKESYIVAGNTTETYYVLKGFVMGAYKTLTLDKTDFAFSNKGFDLYIQLGTGSERVDVIINI